MIALRVTSREELRDVLEAFAREGRARPDPPMLLLLYPCPLP